MYLAWWRRWEEALWWRLMEELGWHPAAGPIREPAPAPLRVWASAGSSSFNNRVCSGVNRDTFSFDPLSVPGTPANMRGGTFSHADLLFTQLFPMDSAADLFQLCSAFWHEPFFRATPWWTCALANDVYGFHAWQSEWLRSLQIGLSGVCPRTPCAPAALPGTLPPLPRPWLARRRPFPARRLLSCRQRVLWPLFGLRLPRLGERSPPVRLHVLPAAQQQQQSVPQQVRADRYVRTQTQSPLTPPKYHKVHLSSLLCVITHKTRVFFSLVRAMPHFKVWQVNKSNFYIRLNIL